MFQYFRFIIFFIFLTTNLWSAGTNDKTTDNEDIKKNEMLKKFLEFPSVKPIYENCEKKQKEKTLTTSLADCIWKEVDDKTKKELQTALSTFLKENKEETDRSPAGSTGRNTTGPNNPNKTDPKNDKRVDPLGGRDYEGVYLGKVKAYKPDEALKQVEDYLVKRLSDSFSGVDPKETKIVDHQTFHALYRSQIGKVIINALSSYCVESKMFLSPKTNYLPDHFLVEENKTEENRKNNIALLTQFDQTGLNEVYKVWGLCVTNIKNICYREKGTNGVNYGDPKILTENSYAHNRACQVTHIIREHRQNLLNTKTVEQGIKDFSANNRLVRFDAKIKYYDYGKGDKEENINELTTLSSREFFDSYKDKAQEASKEFDKKCLEEKDKETCKKYLISGKDKTDLQKELAEFELKRKVMEEKIKNMRSPAQVRQYLKEEGYKEDDIDKMIGDSTDEQLIRDAIERHYSREKNSLIAAINAQLQKSTSSSDEITFDNTGGATSDLSVLQNISKELKSNARRYQEMIHFGNIVAGFLSITSKDPDIKPGQKKDEERNTASLFREIQYEKTAGRNRTPAADDLKESENLIDAKEMEEQLKKAGIENTQKKDDGEPASSEHDLEVATINEALLDYKEAKKALSQTATGTPTAIPTQNATPTATP